MAKSPLELKHLSKYYGKFLGINDISLSIKPGEVFGFLGPNGCGKTTTIKTIMNFLHPSSGEATVLGLDSVNQSTEIKQRVGYLAGDFQMYENLTGRQYLTFIANLRNVTDGQSQIDQLAIKLEANLERKIGTLSRGNMQKIALMSALLHDPDLLILDEPTTGLDPLMQNKFYEIVNEMVSRGKTVFMSSHVLSEAQSICDRVAFMKDGKLIDIIDINKLKNGRKKEVRMTLKKGTKPMKLPKFKDLELIPSAKDSLSFITSEDSQEMLRWLSVQPIENVNIQDVSLEETFLKLYGTHIGVKNV